MKSWFCNRLFPGELCRVDNKHNVPSNVRWFLPLLIMFGTLWVAIDGLHYWHDIRFLYSTSKFELTDVLSGIFNPHQAWAPVSELSAAGFYDSKALHLMVLSSVFSFASPHEGGMAMVIFISVLLMGISVVLSYWFFSIILPTKKLAVFAMISLLLAPVVPYLAGKLLSEITSLFLIVFAFLFLTAAQLSRDKNRIFLAAICGVFLTLACLSRADSLFGFVGFTAASIIVPFRQIQRSQVVLTLFIALSVLMIAYPIILKLFGIQLISLSEYFKAFIGAGQKSVVMSLMSIVSFGGFVYIAAGIGLFHSSKRFVYFFSVWLLVVWIPVAAITWHYMVEPRYLIQGLLPLAGLSALGLDVLLNRLFVLTDYGRKITVTLLAVLVIGFNYIVVRLMPYELDRPAILSAVREIQSLDSDARILVPWSYSDFNFLRVMLPDASIYNVNSPEVGATELENNLLWKRRLQEMVRCYLYFRITAIG